MLQIHTSEINNNTLGFHLFQNVDVFLSCKTVPCYLLLFFLLNIDYIRTRRLPIFIYFKVHCIFLLIFTCIVIYNVFLKSILTSSVIIYSFSILRVTVVAFHRNAIYSMLCTYTGIYIYLNTNTIIIRFWV